jgi:hypothetical protein
MLGGLYKAAVFVLQAQHYCDSGVYIKKRSALKEALTGMDADVLRRADDLREGRAPRADEEAYTALILRWTSEIIRGSR